MRYSLTFHEQDYENLRLALASDEGVERAAYLLCRPVHAEDHTILLVREIVPVAAEDVRAASATHMIIGSRSYTRAMKRADQEKCCFFFVHSHPSGFERHSQADDETEAPLFRTAYNRIKTPGVHGSLVFTDKGVAASRVWLPNGDTAPIERVRIVGRRLRYQFARDSEGPEDRTPEFFDRQVRAFGKDTQRLLKRLRVGLVGAGGTGSSVAEQLIRLGVGSLLVADGETFEASNVNRVYGSRVIDQALPKVKLIERMAADIGLGTNIDILDRPISFRSVVERFRECDAIFACTDDEWGRSILTRLAIYYCIPVFDMGVRIDSETSVIRSIQGRVTSLHPSAACLLCRGRITAERIRAEVIRATNPDEAQRLEAEGYIPELGEPAPAVIMFTSAIAASAVSEFLHRLTGYLGEDRESTEVLHLFDSSRIRTNQRAPAADCFCNDRYFWCRGDVSPLLDQTWRSE